MTLNRLNGSYLLILTAIIWGIAFVAQSTGMETIGPLTFVAGRFALGMVAIAPFAIKDYLKLSTPERKTCYKWSFITGLFLFWGIVLQQIGMVYTTVTNSGFLTALYVPFVPLILLIIFKKPPHFIVWPAVALSFLGIFLLNGAKVDSLNIGDGLVFLSAFFWAGMIISLSFAMQVLPKALLINFGMFFLIFCFASIGAIIFEEITVGNLISALPELAYTGIISSGVAFGLQAVGQKVVPPAQATIIMSLEGVFAALAAYLFLNEQLEYIAYIGCVLIFFAVLLVEVIPEIVKPKSNKTI